MTSALLPNDLAAWWMPYTANRAFKARPRLLSGARDMHFTTPDGRATPGASRRDAAAALQ